VYVSFYKGDDEDAEFVHSVEQDIGMGASGWNFYTPFTGQMDNQRGVDLVWNNTPNSTTINRTYIAHAVDTTADGFDLSTDALFVRTSPLDVSGNYSGYESTTINDFDGDGHDDILWQNLYSGGNNIYVRFGNDTGLNTNRLVQAPTSWTTYTALFGDTDGDGRADVVNPRQDNLFEDFGIYIRNGVARQTDVLSNYQFIQYNSDSGDEVLEPFFGTADAVSPDFKLADVNGDGAQDIIINEKGIVDSLTNNVAVGLSVTGSNQFSFARAAQALPQSTDWSQYTLYIADVDGDLRDDAIWVLNSPTNNVFVGLARSSD